jgi:hypothetical protein
MDNGKEKEINIRNKKEMAVSEGKNIEIKV